MSEFPSQAHRRVHWTLRIGAVLCFLGHGAFGLMGKSAWVPYFGVVGIGSDASWQLMPLVGSVDILLATLVLVQPRPAFLVYMATWAAWTALLRPLAHESGWEALERAGNYGVPFALLLTQVAPVRWWGRVRIASMSDEARRRVTIALVATTALLLVGHGALALSLEPGLVQHAALIDPAHATLLCRTFGAIDLLLAAALLLTRAPSLAVSIALWKLATESLFLVGGSPFWEVVERGGSYAAPLALALLLVDGRRSDTSALRQSARTGQA